MRIVILLTACLGACSVSTSSDDAFQTAVEQSVRKSLREPDSARFEQITINPAEKTACGRVNARNGFGGFTGFQWFSYRDGIVTHADDPDTKEFQASFRICMDTATKRALECAETIKRGGSTSCLKRPVR